MWMEKTTFAKKNPAQRVPTTGAPNYLTSPGGWLQAAWAGWGGLRLNASALHIRRPAPPPNATAMALRGVRFRGNLLDIRIDNDEVSPTAYVYSVSRWPAFSRRCVCAVQLSLTPRRSANTTAAAALMLTVDGTNPRPLVPGATVRLPAASAPLLITASAGDEIVL